jgi:HEAT repeat protein
MLKWRFQLLGSFAALIFLMAGTANAAEDRMLNKKLQETMEKVRVEGSVMARTEAAEHLAELTHGVNPKSVNDKTVADMVSLLDASDDSVRAWVAAALGHLGRRAKVAVPKLLALLPEADCLQGDLTSAASIRPALRGMGVRPPPPPNCESKKEQKK